MKILRYLLILLVLLGLTAGISFYFMQDRLNPDTLQTLQTNKQTYKFPVELSLQNKAGTALEVTLLARNHELVQFMRASDQVHFLYPINQLDEASQKTVVLYPDNGLINPEKFLQDQSISLKQVHAESTRAEIKKLAPQIQRLSAERNAAADRASQRGIQDEIDRLEIKQAKLSLALSQLESNTKNSSGDSKTSEPNTALIPDNLMKMLDLKNELLAE